MGSHRFRILSLLLLPFLAPMPALARTVVPIREARLSDGMRRYAVELQVGGTKLVAGLDTGSTGLRILPGTLAQADAAERGGSHAYRYGSGIELRGARAEAKLAIGEASGTAPVQLVREIGCTERRPDCPAESLPADRYLIQGDGLPGEGFHAIFGIATARQEIANPLVAIGIRRWIVELPRPGEGEGRLVLDPSDEEIAGFVPLAPVAAYAEASGGLRDSVAACLLRDGSEDDRTCGALLMDSGDPGLKLLNAAQKGPWPQGTRATLVLFGEGGKPAAAEHFATGLVAHASRMGVERQPLLPTTVIRAGILPYFGFSVLYDAERHTVAVKPRPPPPGGPSAELVVKP